MSPKTYYFTLPYFYHPAGSTLLTLPVPDTQEVLSFRKTKSRNGQLEYDNNYY